MIKTTIIALSLIVSSIAHEKDHIDWPKRTQAIAPAELITPAEHEIVTQHPSLFETLVDECSLVPDWKERLYNEFCPNTIIACCIDAFKLMYRDCLICTCQLDEEFKSVGY